MKPGPGSFGYQRFFLSLLSLSINQSIDQSIKITCRAPSTQSVYGGD